MTVPLGPLLPPPQRRVIFLGRLGHARAIDWAYAGDAAIAKVPRALAQRTRDEFYPKASLQFREVRGLALTLKRAVEFKYLASPLTVADVQARLIDNLAPAKQ